MKVSINQPYFFPYLGYFQLISSSDIWVNLDHVSFMKRSFMTRNVLKSNISINIPVIGGSQNKSCTEVYADCSAKWFNKFSKILDLLYKNEKNYCEIMDEVLSPWYNRVVDKYSKNLEEIYGPINISLFNAESIYWICKYLNIFPKTTLVYTSKGLTNQKREKGIQDIIKFFDGDIYINAIGGQLLYNKENFKENGIDLKFIQNESKLPNTSILDILFRFPKEEIIQELNNYKLI